MKKHKNVQEWLDSTPAKEDLERDVNTINRGVRQEEGLPSSPDPEQ